VCGLLQATGSDNVTSWSDAVTNGLPAAAVKKAESNGLDANGSSTGAAGLAELAAETADAPLFQVGRMAAKTERGDSTAATGAAVGELPAEAAAEGLRGTETGDKGFNDDEAGAPVVAVANANESMSAVGNRLDETMGDWRICWSREVIRGEGHAMDGVGVLPLPVTELGDLPLTNGRENDAPTASGGKFNCRFAANVGVLCSSTAGNSAGEDTGPPARKSAAGDAPDAAVMTGGDARRPRWSGCVVESEETASVTKGSNVDSSKCRRISEGNPRADNDGDLCMRGSAWAMFGAWVLPKGQRLVKGCNHTRPADRDCRLLSESGTALRRSLRRASSRVSRVFVRRSISMNGV
jgi:hypothetical protein